MGVEIKPGTSIAFWRDILLWLLEPSLKGEINRVIGLTNTGLYYNNGIS